MIFLDDREHRCICLLLCLLQGAFQQVAHIEFTRLFSQIIKIKIAQANLQYAENVAPLPFGDFASQTIPFQLGKYRIFRAGKLHTDFALEDESLPLSAGKLRLKEGTR